MKKVAEPYKKAMVGVLNSKEAFADMCLKYFTDTKSTSELNSFNDRYKMLHETVMQSYSSFNLIEIEDIYNLENHSILSTNIVAKEDNPLSTIIKKLNNSDNPAPQRERFLKHNDAAPNTNAIAEKITTELS